MDTNSFTRKITTSRQNSTLSSFCSSLHHILRGENAYAYILAKMRVNNLDNLIVLHQSSPNLLSGLLADVFGVFF